jgi:hypothetical protein
VLEDDPEPDVDPVPLCVLWCRDDLRVVLPLVLVPVPLDVSELLLPACGVGVDELLGLLILLVPL